MNSSYGMNGNAKEFNPPIYDNVNYDSYSGEHYDMTNSYMEGGGYYDTYDYQTGEDIPEGSFYQSMQPFVPHVQSAPVSAIAIDPTSDATYVAGHTVQLQRKRHHRGYTNSSVSERASMLATHLLSDGSLYSACAAHPEAKKEILDSIASSVYGSAFTKTGKSELNKFKVPSHAFQAPYQSISKNGMDMMSKGFHMGITKILPFSSKVASSNLSENHEKTEGYHCSISPGGVRVHTPGGLQVCSNNIVGMIAGTFHPGIYTQDGMDEKNISSCATHVTVGGVSSNRSGTNLFCMDLYSSALKVVASHAVRPNDGSKMCISDLATNHETSNIIAACSDGTLRIFDGNWRGGNFMESAKIKAHAGGVNCVATSGNLICTTGFSSRSPANVVNGSSQLYAFPDEHVLVFDIRFLGRGGICHPVSVLKGGPRFVTFIPGLNRNLEDRILVASGQNGGGLQIINPFESLSQETTTSRDYLNPPLDINEAISAMSYVGENLAIGTSLGNVFQYSLSGYENIVPRGGDDIVKMSNEPLETPTFLEPPPLSIEPFLLQGSVSHDTPSMSIFNPYLMNKPPTITPTYVNNEWNPYSFGPLTKNVCKPAQRKELSENLTQILGATQRDEYISSIQTSTLGVNLINQNPAGKGKNELMNANRLLSKTFENVFYKVSDPRKSSKKGNDRDMADTVIPERYRNKDRPPSSMFSIFDFAALNNTIFPGYDYPPTMSNSYICSVLLALYFVPEIQNSILESQQKIFTLEIRGKKNKAASMLSGELGFLFDQINDISSHAMCHPKPPGMVEDPCKPVLSTFVPSNFLSAFVTMQEASSLALLDDSPAAAEKARRPEAFYRFVLHQLDKELAYVSENGRNTRQTGKKTIKSKVIDNLQGIDSVSMNHFITGSGPPSATFNRTYTVELSYEAFIGNSDNELPDFMHILQYSLSKHVRLRAWCEATKKFETVVQRKIITTLPKVLSLSCSCAGALGEDRLPFWRKSSDDYDHWLPELIEIEIDHNFNIVTRQLVTKDGSEKWLDYRGKSLPASVIETIKENARGMEEGETRCARYRLDLVLSYLNEECNDGGTPSQGRHVVHAKIPKSYRERALRNQLENLKECLNDHTRVSSLTLLRDVSGEDLLKRMEYVENELKKLRDSPGCDDWILFNGPSVTHTTVDDALAFHVSFKEPCIILYRQVDADVEEVTYTKLDIPDAIWTDLSPLRPYKPNKYDVVAFDAEFVQVENESSVLTATGSKVVVREGRNAVGRISILDSKSGNILSDDHVLPREPVVDCLTRFSGITPSDLDPKLSRHHLISCRHAYLKIRYLAQRGCKFVGHGLRQDFLVVNLFVPPLQIIDTVDIFYLQENRRFISLRFLANYLLQRDMQIEVHDSVEDSRAAHELYLKALTLKANGTFEETLRKIYEKGQQCDWKVTLIPTEMQVITT